jgi:hypothetical protein
MSLLDFGLEGVAKEPEKVIKDPEKILYRIKGDKGIYYLKDSGIYRVGRYGDIELICPTYIDIVKVGRVNNTVEINMCYGKSKVEIKQDLTFFLDIKKVRTLSEEFRTIRGNTKYVKDYCLSKIWEMMKGLEGETSSLIMKSLGSYTSFLNVVNVTRYQ